MSAADPHGSWLRAEGGVLLGRGSACDVCGSGGRGAGSAGGTGGGAGGNNKCDCIAEYVCTLTPANELGIVARTPSIELGGADIAQSVSLVYQHSTGGCVWGATPCFAAWIQRVDSPLAALVAGRAVVELGSGTGALAMLLHAFVGARYVATDQRPLLKLCARNCGGLPKVEVAEFDWEQHEFPGIDEDGVVIACDTVYNEYLISPFCDAVASVWRSSPRVSQAIVTVQVRELGVLEAALQQFVDRFGSARCFELEGYVVILLEQPSSFPF